MPEPLSSNTASAPWLHLRLQHHFPPRSAGFHLRVALDLHASRAVLFGPSGSGKSSLLRAIAGLLQADSGEITVLGETLWQRSPGARPAHSVPAEKRLVGLVLQQPAIFPHLTVAGNVGFALRGMEKHARDTKVLDLLRMFDAEPLAHRAPRELSGGQWQRVAIARTLAAEPSVLLLDEPFAALDTASRRQVSHTLHRWAAERRVPVLTVTHNLEEAFAVGEEVVVMESGTVRAQGPPAQVLAAERDHLLRTLGAVPDSFSK